MQIVVRGLTAASGSAPSDLGGTLQSDVVVMVTEDPCSEENPCPTIVNDVGEVELGLVLKDPGSPGNPASPSALNSCDDQSLPRRVPENRRSQRSRC